MIETDKGEYIDFENKLEEWKARISQSVNATEGKEFAGGWTYLKFKHVLNEE